MHRLRRGRQATALLALASCTGGTEVREAVASIAILASKDTLIVGDSAELFADLRDGARGPVIGVLPAWRSSNPTIAPVRATGRLPSAIVTTIAPGRVEISASSGRTIGRTALTVLPLSAFDVDVEGAQWTQAAQTATGALPMVRDGNAAVVNVLLRTTIRDRAIGTLVLTVRDRAGAIVHRDAVTARPVAARTTYADPSAQFLVPARVLRDGLSWNVVRDPGRAVPDGNAANDSFPRSGFAQLATVSLPAMHIRFVPLELAAHGNLRLPLVPSALPQLLSAVRGMLPTSGLTASIAPVLRTTARFGAGGLGGTREFWATVLGDVQLTAQTADSAWRDAFWIAIAPIPDGFSAFQLGGLAFIGGPAGVTSQSGRIAAVLWVNGSYTSSTVAHEIGHNLGRLHAPCGQPGELDPEYPDGNGWIGTPGHDVRSWADGESFGATPRGPTTGDLMGYCTPTWIGPYTYAAMIDAQLARFGAVRQVRAREPVVVIRGAIDGDAIRVNSLVLDDAAPTETDGTDAAVELLDQSGRVIARRQVALQRLDHSSSELFSVAFPRRNLALEQVVRVRVRIPGREWVRRVPD